MKTMYNLNVITTQFLAYGTDRVTLEFSCCLVIRHLLRRQLFLQWYLQQQRVRVRVMIGFLVWGRVSIRVRVGVTFNVRVYHWSNCHRSKCRTFTTAIIHSGISGLYTKTHFHIEKRNTNIVFAIRLLVYSKF